MTRLVTPDGTVILAAVPQTGTAPAFSSDTSDDRAQYNPNFSAGPTGLDPYRPWSESILDGFPYYANGFDNVKRWDGVADSYNMGAAAPTGFSLADDAAGTTFAAGLNVRYKIVLRNDNNGKESCPQVASSDDFYDDGELAISHTMVANKDISITLPVDPGGEWTHAAIYRALDGDDGFYLVAKSASWGSTYTDNTPDTTLRTKTPYVPRFRTTLPPKFEGMVEWDNRFWGWELNGNKAHYSQQAGVFDTDELVQEDFPPLWSIGIAPEEGAFGLIRAARAYDDSMFWWKDRAAYELRGSTNTLAVRRMYADRGALNFNCIVDVEGLLVILDEQGLYLWQPGSYPVIAGADPETKESRLLPIWRRMNRALRRSMHIHYDQNERLVKCYVALDHEPVADTPIIYDPQIDRFQALDVGKWGGAAGIMVDGSGSIHACRGDDLGNLWDEDIGDAGGATEGDLTATVTSGSATDVTCSGASFDTTDAGPVGTPYTRGTAGQDYDDLNRVQSVTGTVITPVYYSTDTPSSGETVLLGVVPSIAQTPKLTFGTVKKKWVREIVVEHDSGYSGTLSVETACDDGSFVVKKSIDMSTAVRTIVPCDDRCWTWSLRFTQQASGAGFAIRSVRVLVQLIEDRR